MKNVLITAYCLFLSSQIALAEQSTSNLIIDSPKDALSLVGTDNLGTVSLESLIHDIKEDVVYREKTTYSTGYVSVESQNSYGHFGGVDFEFEPPYDFTKEDVISHAQSMQGVKVTDSGTRVYLRWSSNEFDCSLDYDADEEYPLFQYLCHYSGD